MKKKELKQQIREMTSDALREEMLALLKEQFGLKVQRAVGQLKRHHRMREIRRSIARIKTSLAASANKTGEIL